MSERTEPPTIGWYAHHQGRGHVIRARQVVRHLDADATLLTSASVGDGAWPGAHVELPMDVHPDAVELPETRLLHWAPGHVPGLRARTRKLATWFDEARPALVVVDVSVEVAVLARLSGVPVAWVRQHGERWDDAHQGAYEAASLVVCPWPEWFDDDVAAGELGDRVVHTGGFSRLEGRVPDRAAARDELGWGTDDRHVVVLLGGGGTAVDRAVLRSTASATRHWRWTVLGLPDAPDQASEDEPFEDVGWCDDPAVHLAAADVVVSSAGHNAVLDVGAAGAPLVVVPQSRPWHEQDHKARLLDEHELAHVWDHWPEPDHVAGLLDRAVFAPRSPAALLDGDGAARMAAEVDRVAVELAPSQ